MDRRADEGRESFQSLVTAPFLHAKALQLLSWYTLTENDISLYHFNTTSICSIMHNNEKNFDLERKKSPNSVMIRSTKPYRSTSKLWCADQICIADQGNFTDCNTPCNQKSSSVSYDSLMLTLHNWQN